MSIFGNILRTLSGGWILFAITIIDLPFAMQHITPAGLDLVPFGRNFS